MTTQLKLARGLIAALFLIAATANAGLLPGFGEVSGELTGAKGDVVPVYLHNKEKNVGYGVFAVNGSYRATNMFPGQYEVTVQNWYVPSEEGLEMDPVSIEVFAGKQALLDLEVKSVAPKHNYTGRETYPEGVVVEPYDAIYPAGAGREILEQSCIVCHGVNFIPSKSLNRAGWQAMVNLMIKKPEDGGLFRGAGLSAGNPIVGPSRLSAEELPVLLDYLEENFGPETETRAVLQDEWPAVDHAALSKAMYIEYRLPNSPGIRRGSHSLNFDQNGIVYVTDPGGYIVRVDPATADIRDYEIPDGNSSHGITVDGDGTVWFVGRDNFLARLDPATGLFDQYPTTERGLHGNTPSFTPDGDLWFTMLIGNKLGHWDRATDTITYYESPVANAHPYGMDIDHDGKIWYAEYFAGAITRFDPESREFKRFVVPTWPNSLRRLGVDSKNNIWFGVYGYVGKYGKLGRIDAKTGEITEREVPIKYGQPYDAKADSDDNIWIASMNYLTRFEESTGRFTVYPTPERTDQPKIEPTRDGAIWYAPRRAGGYGYGTAASVLYPDKDAITTLRAMPGPGLSSNHIAKYRGSFTKVTGAVKLTKPGAQNPGVDYEKTVGTPKDGSEPKAAPGFSGTLDD